MSLSMSPWVEKFVEWYGSSGYSQVALAAALECSNSQVWYWKRGSEPRDPRLLKRIEKLSKGKVAAKLAEPGKGRTR